MISSEILIPRDFFKDFFRNLSSIIVTNSSRVSFRIFTVIYLGIFPVIRYGIPSDILLAILSRIPSRIYYSIASGIPP